MPISLYGQNNPDLARFLPDPDATVWRYMDIGKYLDLITRRELWFTRISEFRKTDPYEGALTKYDTEKVTKILAAASTEELKTTLLRYREADLAALIEQHPQKSHLWFQLVFLTQLPIVEMNAYTYSVSCWHANPTESDGMWELYGKRDAGVAIKASVERLLRAFSSSARSLYVAKVSYDSENILSALTSGMIDSILIKRHAFRHEDEVRVIATTMDGYEAPDWTQENQTYRVDPSMKVPPGCYVACDLDVLIEEIVISPLMPDHAACAVETASRSFLRNTPIRKSTLLRREELPFIGSAKLAIMWAEYQKKKLLLDFDEIPLEVKPSLTS
jgi:hypothetical protein